MWWDITDDALCIICSITAAHIASVTIEHYYFSITPNPCAFYESSLHEEYASMWNCFNRLFVPLSIKLYEQPTIFRVRILLQKSDSAMIYSDMCSMCIFSTDNECGLVTEIKWGLIFSMESHLLFSRSHYFQVLNSNAVRGRVACPLSWLI